MTKLCSTELSIEYAGEDGLDSVTISSCKRVTADLCAQQSAWQPNPGVDTCPPHRVALVGRPHIAQSYRAGSPWTYEHPVSLNNFD